MNKTSSTLMLSTIILIQYVVFQKRKYEFVSLGAFAS